MQHNDLDLALIGNCNLSALINSQGDISWMCLPRFDGDPVFNTLLQHPLSPDSPGMFSISLRNFVRSEQFYLENTAILKTRLWDKDNNAIEITDFMPRFQQFGRTYFPLMLIRRLEPVSGTPRIQIKIRPSYNWGASLAGKTVGSNHISYQLDSSAIRLTTDISLTSIQNESYFVLDKEHSLILSQDETLRESVATTSRNFLEQTESYWREWVRNLYIPYEWQEAVIRAAITLKLSSYEDTGAIVAAMTTSIPEAPHSSRNWDYRYCWIRDAYFVINALNRLSKTYTMEHYLAYIINVVVNVDDQELQPVYTIDGGTQLVEREIDTLSGYRGMGPVRVGNQAYEQQQNDVYGSVILAAAHLFFDRRLSHPVGSNSALFQVLELMGEKAYEYHDKPDAGPWEFRNTLQVHTYSSLVCWAGCDRLAKIAEHMELPERATLWKKRADEIYALICEKAWDPKLNSFVESFDGQHLDASLLLINELGFVKADDPRFIGTVQAIETHLKRGKFIYRYNKVDDFGKPETAFTVCTFWYINALVALKRIDEARELFEEMLSCRNKHGLLSEDITPDSSKELWGNFPQTYSMVGLINAAIRLSKRWEDAF